MKCYLVTYGCQMNKYTSRKAEGILNKLGYAITTQEEEADLILVNTCSVRASAEERAIGRIQTLAGLKRQNPNVKIGVMGCMAARLGNSLFELIPKVDFSLGPNEIERLESVISKFEIMKVDFALGPNKMGRLPALIKKGCAPLEQTISCIPDTLSLIDKRRAPVHTVSSSLKAFVAISTGCDNFCSYCIVPFVRGSLVARPSGDILAEIKDLAESGTKEITLLGQDVTAYRLNGTSFPDLLLAVSHISGVERIRFLTSHPRGVDDRLIDVVAGNQKVCPHFHLPIQSGSDRILRDMNRGYTSKDYERLTDRIRERIPEVSITTDIIVGFPTEEKSDFDATLKAIERVRPDSSFCFAYSNRPGTKAERLPEIDQKEKHERLKRLIELTKAISGEKNSRVIGTRQDVLVEGRNPKDADGELRIADCGSRIEKRDEEELRIADCEERIEKRDEEELRIADCGSRIERDKALMGRTATNKVCLFEGEDSLIGKTVSVCITGASAYTLKGGLYRE